jgi:SAM-dependent methyltransferase
MRDNWFDERVAAVYDASSADMFDPAVVEPAVDLLAGLAGDGAALELAIGTGRIGLPLSRRGVPVHGIELSEAMAARLRAKPGADAVEVTIGDMATTRVGGDGAFRLVYLVFNTIGNLLTQDDQVACFRNAAAHLEPGGRFVVEVVVPDLRRVPPGETTRVFARADGYVGFDEYVDFAGQLLWSHHWRTGGDTDDHVAVFRTPHRWVWPSELDLMARLAGMSLEARYAGWDKSPFTDDSPAHISIWRKHP